MFYLNVGNNKLVIHDMTQYGAKVAHFQIRCGRIVRYQLLQSLIQSEQTFPNQKQLVRTWPQFITISSVFFFHSSSTGNAIQAFGNGTDIGIGPQIPPVQTTTSITTPNQRKLIDSTSNNYINTDPGIYQFCGNLQVRRSQVQCCSVKIDKSRQKFVVRWIKKGFKTTFQSVLFTPTIIFCYLQPKQQWRCFFYIVFYSSLFLS